MKKLKSAPGAHQIVYGMLLRNTTLPQGEALRDEAIQL